jgi:single-stranded DNA-specific DHH superfamily exonuclease
MTCRVMITLNTPSAKQSRLTLLVPDKDADGLSAGVIVWRTLSLLGHDSKSLRVHLLAKGSNPHVISEREAMAAYGADYAIVLDHGSRRGQPLVPPKGEGGKRVKTLLLDHHLSDEFPEQALVRPYTIVHRYSTEVVCHPGCLRVQVSSHCYYSNTSL